MKTKQRILNVALDLFNGQGERQVTTNHLADALDMSPGNLYYHYKNKNDIVLALFQQYQQEVAETLTLPEDRSLQLLDKFHYLEKIFLGLWRYRFLHRDLEHFLQINEDLREAYQAFFKFCLDRTMAIYQGLKQADIIEIDEADIQPLAINTWLIVTSWVAFSHDNLANGIDQSNTKLSAETLITTGMKQVLALEKPYLHDPYREALQKEFEQFAKTHLAAKEVG